MEPLERSLRSRHEDFVSGAAAGVRGLVAESWGRSMATGISPDAVCLPIVFEHDELAGYPGGAPAAGGLLAAVRRARPRSRGLRQGDGRRRRGRPAAFVSRRDRLESRIRQAVLTSHDPDLLAAWTRTRWGVDDLEGWERLVPLLPAASPLRAMARGEVDRLRVEYGLARS